MLTNPSLLLNAVKVFMRPYADVRYNPSRLEVFNHAEAPKPHADASDSQLAGQSLENLNPVLL